MKNVSLYILAILVFGLIGTPMYHQAINYKTDQSSTLGVNAFAESDKQDSENHDNEQDDSSDQSNSENDTNNQADSEDKSDDTDQSESEDQSEDNTDIQSENDTNNEPDDSDNQSQNDTQNDQQKSEAKSEQLISELEQKVTQLEQRIQLLLEKVQNGQYFGSAENTNAPAKSYMMSFEGTATSIQDSSVSAPVSADIFAENLMTKDGFGKLKITGGQIDIGKTTYDIVFGKVRITDNQDQGSFVLLVAEVMDDSGNITTIRLNLDSAQSFQMADTEPLDLKIDSPQSKIAGQWILSGTGSLSS